MMIGEGGIIQEVEVGVEIVASIVTMIEAALVIDTKKGTSIQTRVLKIPMGEREGILPGILVMKEKIEVMLIIEGDVRGPLDLGLGRDLYLDLYLDPVHAIDPKVVIEIITTQTVTAVTAQSVGIALEAPVARIQDQGLDLRHLAPAIAGAEGELVVIVVDRAALSVVVIGVGTGVQVIRIVEPGLGQKDPGHRIEVFAGVEAGAPGYRVTMTGREMPRGRAAHAHILTTDNTMK